jgi:hypothetical protein
MSSPTKPPGGPPGTPPKPPGPRGTPPKPPKPPSTPSKPPSTPSAPSAPTKPEYAAAAAAADADAAAAAAADASADEDADEDKFIIIYDNIKGTVHKTPIPKTTKVVDPKVLDFDKEIKAMQEKTEAIRAETLAIEEENKKSRHCRFFPDKINKIYTNLVEPIENVYYGILTENDKIQTVSRTPLICEVLKNFTPEQKEYYTSQDTKLILNAVEGYLKMIETGDMYKKKCGDYISDYDISCYEKLKEYFNTIKKLILCINFEKTNKGVPLCINTGRQGIELYDFPEYDDDDKHKKKYLKYKKKYLELKNKLSKK